MPRLGGHNLSALEVDEPGCLPEGEVDLARVEDVENYNFVFAVAEMLQACDDAPGIIPRLEVRDEDDKPALLYPLRQFMEDLRGFGKVWRVGMKQVQFYKF